MKDIRLGIVGIGNMGSVHASYILSGKVTGCRLAAVCDLNSAQCDRLDSMEGIQFFDDIDSMLSSDLVDAVIICTPHYFHTTQGIKALEAGLHVLVEKPISVHKADCERLLAAHQNKDQVFAAAFNQRMRPPYKKLHELLTGDQLGKIMRVNWICTAWFRTQAYYDSASWRASWKGEGGGVLVNQSPHQLDLMTWLFGMPDKVRGFCHFGKYHNITVEDEVTAYLEYPNGATGVFIINTAEAPGTDRLEVCGDMGRIVVENGAIHWTRNEKNMTDMSRNQPLPSVMPETWEIDIPMTDIIEQHVVVLQNFVDAIREGKDLITPAHEGINSVELSNAIVYSSLQNRMIDLPLDSAAYEAELRKLIESEGADIKKPTAGANPLF